MGTESRDQGSGNVPNRAQRLRGVTRSWLNAGEDIILVGVAVILLLAGLLVIANAVSGFASALSSSSIAQTVFGVAESALLALILAELVHSLLVSLDGGGLTLEPFLVIAIVAILRKMLLTTVLIPSPTEAQGLITPSVAELLALGLVILALTVALAISRRHGNQARPE
ncbi:MAG TPA: phosphate-starvation-inducible PsiE family protein [Chloroflexota bacterium]|nr:phosphate-starvation-inducible PsiE family protein [Chloroflexota bacterium]